MHSSVLNCSPSLDGLQQILAPQVGLEPTTLRLTAGCSTIELLRLLFIKESQHLPIFPGRLQPSIFGTTQLNFRVRDGNGWGLSVIGTGFHYIVTAFSDVNFFYLVTGRRVELLFAA